MFQVAVKRVASKRWQGCDFLSSHRLTGPSNFRHISSLEPSYSLQSRHLYIGTLAVCRINKSNIPIHHGGYRSTSASWLIHQRRWFSDETQPPPKKVQEQPGQLSRIVPAIRQRVTHFNTGDLMSVYAIVVLILVIVFSPFIAR
jgi:hypothetical protein